jgi:hypothetical protein
MTTDSTKGKSDESDPLVRRANADDWGPHEVPEEVENPHGVGITFWVYDSRAFAFGHELAVETANGTALETVWVNAGQALVFEDADHDRSLSVHPYKANPESWEVFGEGGVKASYEGTPGEGVYEWTVEVDGEERRYWVRSESIAEENNDGE